MGQHLAGDIVKQKRRQFQTVTAMIPQAEERGLSLSLYSRTWLSVGRSGCPILVDKKRRILEEHLKKYALDLQTSFVGLYIPNI